MDKNMINIDDFVRQRLADGEEKEPAGAWLNMKDLLDNNMPVNNPIGFNWKRMLGIASVLVLISFFTVGSYYLINTYRNNNEAKIASTEKNAAIISTSTPISNSEIYNQSNSTIKSTDKSNSLNTTIASKATEKTTTEAQATKNNNKENSNEEAITKNASTTKALNNSTKNKIENSKNDVVQPDLESKSLKENNLTATLDHSKQNPQSLSVSLNETVNKNSISKIEKLDNTSPLVNQNKSLKQDAETKPETIEKPVLSMLNTGLNKADNTSSINNTELRKPELPKDSMGKMVIIQHSIVDQNNRTRKYVNDTISIQKIAVDKSILDKLSKKDNVTASVSNSSIGLKNTNNISSTTQNVAMVDQAMNTVLVPLSNYKVHSRRTTKWNARSFDDVVRDVKFNLSQIRFYPGISFGGNSNFGANNLSGVQLGLFGLFTFGENWNAMAELKYLYHFNNGSVLEDNYMDIKTNASSQHIQSKVEHFFKFSSLQSIEMPIAIRYAAGRINLFGGINMAYNFRVNAEEVTLTPNDSSYVQVSNPNWNNSKPIVSYDDFKSRFSLGYLLGAGYQISPSLQIDMRMTKNFWDNASGSGAEKVSHQYFKAPSIQFSLFYRFSQNNKIINQ